jgi:hypothetical protein
MKIQLRKIEFSERLSEETNAYAADIYIDGVKVGTAQNQGTGGETMIEPLAARDQIQSHAMTLPPLIWWSQEIPDGPKVKHELVMDAELFIDGLLEKWLDAKVRAKESKKFDRDIATRMLYIDAEGRPLASSKVAPDRIKALLANPAFHESYQKKAQVCLNALPLEDAKARWLKAVGIKEPKS